MKFRYRKSLRCVVRKLQLESELCVSLFFLIFEYCVANELNRNLFIIDGVLKEVKRLRRCFVG